MKLLLPPRFIKASLFGAAALCLGALLLLTDLPSTLQITFMRSSAPEAAMETTAPEAAPEPAAPAFDEYGLPHGSFKTVDIEIQRNETFADILTSHNVPYSRVVELVDVARPVFDVRRLQAGKPIRVYQDPSDSLEAARYLVYAQDPVNYVVFELGDSLSAYEGEREVEVRQQRVSGTINNSLYATLDGEGLDGRLVPLLAGSLSEVFAWQIDFFRIQKGDAFSVLYEERVLDGEPVGMGRILAAHFVHMDRDYYGIYFDQDGEGGDYYDDEGESLRKAFLRAPLKYKRISSRYTKRRFHPVQKRWKAHLGTDYAADPGTPIYAVGDGVILDAKYQRYNGNYVKIRHNGTYTTGYLHMSRIAKGIRPGVRVKQGELIGYVGSTGLATGPHLCYRFWKDGTQVDPLKQEFPSAHPIDPNLRPAFEQVRDLMLARLEASRSFTPMTHATLVRP